MGSRPANGIFSSTSGSAWPYRRTSEMRHDHAVLVHPTNADPTLGVAGLLRNPSLEQLRL